MEDISKCPAMRTCNVFGEDDKPCCYNEMRYCENIPNCEYKKLIGKLNRLKRLCDYSFGHALLIKDIEDILEG